MIAWMVYVIAISAALGLAALAVERALGLYHRPTRWAWVAAMAGSLAIPAALLVVPRAAPTSAADVAPPVTIEAPLVGSVADRVTQASTSGWPDLGPWLVVGWGVASLVLLVSFARSAWRLRRSRRRWRPAEIAGQPVLESASIGPAVVGVVRTRIAVPAWIRDLDEDLQALVLAHERSHQAASDPLLLWFGVAACVAVPWCAPLWWQLRRLRLAIEVDCDRRVLAGGASLARYGSLLLEVGRRSGGRPFALVGLFEPRSFLERRIRVMTLSPPRKRWIPTLIALALIIAAASAIAVTPIPERPFSRLGFEGEPTSRNEDPGGWYLVIVTPHGTDASSAEDLKPFAASHETRGYGNWKTIVDRISVPGPGSCGMGAGDEGPRLIVYDRSPRGLVQAFTEPATCYLVYVEHAPHPVGLIVGAEHRHLDTGEELYAAGYRARFDLRRMNVYRKELLDRPEKISCGYEMSGWPEDGEEHLRFTVGIGDPSQGPPAGSACFFLLPEEWDPTELRIEVGERRNSPNPGARQRGILEDGVTVDSSPPATSPVPVDTPPRFERTTFDERPVCIENCSADAILAALVDGGVESATCDAVIGIRIGVEGAVTATDVLKSDEACEEALTDWAGSTRWTPARRDGDPIPVWIAQPIRLYPEPESAESPNQIGAVHVEAETDPDAIAKTTLRRAMTAQEMYRAENGEYADAFELDLSPPRTVTLEVRSNDGGYVMVARHDHGTAAFCASSVTRAIVEGTDC